MIPFRKMHGAGNDFVVVSDVEVTEGLARAMCDPHKGIGADGLLLVGQSPPSMRMWNPDGSEAEMCGNGLRCAAKLLFDQISTDALPIQTAAGLKQARRAETLIRVEMGKADLTRGALGLPGDASDTFLEQPLPWKPFLGSAASMGNPHLVIQTSNVDEIDLDWYGALFEKWDLFPNGTNVHFIQKVDDSTLKVRHWERGAGATLACGSGACASAAVAVRLGLCKSPVEAQLPGGTLTLEVGPDLEIAMIGPAEYVFSGEWPA